MSGSKKELIGLDRMVAAALFIESSGFNSESKIGTSEVTSGFALTYGESSRAVKLLISKSGSFYTQGSRQCVDSLHDESLWRNPNKDNVYEFKVLSVFVD